VAIGRTAEGVRTEIILDPVTSRVLGNRTVAAGLTGVPAGTVLGWSTYTAEALLAKPDGQGFTGSPYLYHLRWSEPGRVPDDLVRRFTDRALVCVRSEHASTGPGQTGSRDDLVEAALPFTLQEFYSPDTPWLSSFQQSTGEKYESYAQSAPRTFALGKPVTERWNTAVFGPSFPPYPDPANWTWRTGDTAVFNLWLLGDQDDNHAGMADDVDSATTSLYRDGQKIDEQPWAGFNQFTLPPEEAAYRLHSESTRSGASDLSTRVSADWTFRSGHVADTGFRPVPLLAVRFAPRLDNANQAPAGVPFVVPVGVQHTGSDAEITKLTVQVSYDDGATWLPTVVARTGDHWAAGLRHPAHATFASFRATAVDTAGNSVDQTIIRAYRLE
jgi:hypothetical protein